MTAYEYGFLLKCAEFRVPVLDAVSFLMRKTAEGGWLDYSGLEGYDNWQLPREKDIDKYLSWRSSGEKQPYDPLSQNPRFGAYRMAPGASVFRSLVDERDANGDEVDFYPFVRGGFEQQMASMRAPGLSEVTSEQADAAARTIADRIVARRKAYLETLRKAREQQQQQNAMQQMQVASIGGNA